MVTTDQIRQLEREVREAQARLDRARAENARADAAWESMVAQAEQTVRTRNVRLTPELFLDAARVRRGEVVSVAEARRQRLEDKR